MNDEKIILRQMSEDDWEIFRSIRLEALKEHPCLFLKSYDKEKTQEEEYWRNYLRGERGAVFVLEDNGIPIGLTGAFRYSGIPEDTVSLGMSFIRSEYRGRGLSGLFYEARINWAKNQSGVNRIIVAHRAGNEASKRANQKFGFTLYEVKEIDFPDGSRDDEYKYELRWD